MKNLRLPKAMRGALLLRMLLLIVVPAAAAIGALYWYAANARYVTTDNAYVKSDIITISSSIDGRVTEVFVRDNQLVEKGDLLFKLDSRPHEIALHRADAKLKAISNNIESMRAQYAQITSEINDAEERLKYLKRQHRRQEELGAQGMTTESAIEDAAYQVIQATQALSGARQKAKRQLAELGGDLNLSAEEHPEYLTTLSERRNAELNLEYTKVHAPADGTVSRMRLQPGEWVDAGEPIFSLLDRTDIWIEANLKETQLTDIAIGQHVNFEVDAYPDTTFTGTIASISGATGSEFLILPPQNATGNWVKVVQRIPVRVEIDSQARGDGTPHPLRAGMTVHVSIDTEREHHAFGFITEALGTIRGG